MGEEKFTPGLYAAARDMYNALEAVIELLVDVRFIEYQNGRQVGCCTEAFDGKVAAMRVALAKANSTPSPFCANAVIVDGATMQAIGYTHYYADCPNRRSGDVFQATIGTGDSVNSCPECGRRVRGRSSDQDG